MLNCKVQHMLLIIICMDIPTAVRSARFPSRKTWWTKQITYDLHVAGWLTRSQFKFAREGGFKTILSVYHIEAPGYIGTDRTDPLLTTNQEIQIARELGFQFSTVLRQGNDQWYSPEALERFTTLFNAAQKPVLLHSKTSYSATFMGLMHYFARSKDDPNAQPKINLNEFFMRASAIGHDYTQKDMTLTRILEVDGSSNTNSKIAFPKPQLSLPLWNTKPGTWKLKNIGKNIFLAGQLGRNDVPILKSLGFNILVNSRKGVKSGGYPSQEENILLNIRDKTLTYDANGTPVRQTRSVLEGNRVNASLPVTYISATSKYNYEAINVLQFGDAIGYNETLERLAAEAVGLEYRHYPVGGVYKYGMPLWYAYRDYLMELGRNYDAILLQCRTGYRSGVLGLLLYGCLNDLRSNEILKIAHRMGYEFVLNSEVEVVNMFRTVLDSCENMCETKNDGGRQPRSDLSGGKGSAVNMVYHVDLVLLSLPLCYFVTG